jgi:hypothetical protein
LRGAAELERRPRFAIAGGSEAEIGAEIEVIVLLVEEHLAANRAQGGIDAGVIEGRFQHGLAIDHQPRGAAGAQQHAVLAGRELHGRGSPDERGKRAVGAHARGDVLVRQLEEPEHVLRIALGDL